MIVITTPTCSDLLHPPLPALQPPVALPIFSRSSAFGSHSIIDEEWENTFRRWYPDFRLQWQAKKAA
jgi:hypothetical protein